MFKMLPRSQLLLFKLVQTMFASAGDALQIQRYLISYECHDAGMAHFDMYHLCLCNAFTVSSITTAQACASTSVSHCLDTQQSSGIQMMS